MLFGKNIVNTSGRRLVGCLRVAQCTVGIFEIVGKQGIQVQVDRCHGAVVDAGRRCEDYGRRAPEAVVEMPSDEVARCVVCELYGSALEIYPEENADRRVLSRIDAAHPIKVTICSSSFSAISTTAWSNIKCENSRFGSSFDINNTGQMNLSATDIRLADRLELNNTGTMRLAVRDIDADRAVCINNTGSFKASVRNIAAGSKFELNNTGAITLGADRYACRNWVDNNAGRTDIAGRVEADRIECNSAGLERLSLDIACRKLVVYTSGSGDIVFRGCADDVDVASTGNARVSTREVE